MDQKRQLMQLTPRERVAAVLAILQPITGEPMPREVLFQYARVQITRANKETKNKINDLLRPLFVITKGRSECYVMPDEARLVTIKQLNVDERSIKKDVAAEMVQQWDEFMSRMPFPLPKNRKL